MTDADEQFRRRLTQLANATSEMMAELMDGNSEPIRQLFEQSDIVYGVWRDASKPCGVDYHVLKGSKLLRQWIADHKAGELLRQWIADQKSFTARVAAILCECFEQATAAKEVFGERDFDA